MWVLASQAMDVFQVPSKGPVDWAESSAGKQTAARHANLLILMDDLQ
jgi:hypothetical protein